MQRAAIGIGVLAAIGIGATVGWVVLGPSGSQAPGADAAASRHVVAIEGAEIGGPFTLTSHTGGRVTSEQVIDGPSLVYFGYTWCPDVCPIDTQHMVDAVDRLDRMGLRVDPVFVTVDPARDDVESLSAYAEAFHPRMTALTGERDEIKAAADAYKVYFSLEKTEPDQTDYLVNHTSFTYLMLPGDELAAMFRHGTPPEVMAAEVARILERRGLTG